MKYLTAWATVVIVTSGCAANREAAEKALTVNYRLDRENAERYFNLRHGFPVTYAVAESVSPGGSSDPAENLGSLVASLALVLTVGVAEGTIGGLVDLLTTTDVFMEVEDYPRFTQQVYWGNNRVKVPKELAGKRVPIRLLFKGEYQGALRAEIDLTKR